jgi:hypothetical protein
MRMLMSILLDFGIYIRAHQLPKLRYAHKHAHICTKYIQYAYEHPPISPKQHAELYHAFFPSFK